MIVYITTFLIGWIVCNILTFNQIKEYAEKQKVTASEWWKTQKKSEQIMISILYPLAVLAVKRMK